MIIVYDLIYILSDVGCFDQDEIIKARRIMLGQRKNIKRLDVALKDRSTYRPKASGHEFGHWAKKREYCAKDIGVAEVN